MPFTHDFPISNLRRVAFTVAAIAQLEERQTENLKAPGSIPGLSIYDVFLHDRTRSASEVQHGADAVDGHDTVSERLKRKQGFESLRCPFAPGGCCRNRL